ncbi:GTP pyrophosphokinase [Pectobacterium brasiliense]|uniref:GTP pyrophosphokinase n=1 Tax=Pectobacterium brasiliense TaxID=180957 RepID=UPI00068D96E2|nr:RelA/SpoT domain-containing protein [Pectobacterium brasiliense]
MSIEFKEWVSEKLPYFRLMSTQLASVIENLLKQNNVTYFSIDSRTKDTNGIEEKIKRKNYKDPKVQLTDISGIRIILYIEDDVKKVCDIIKETFNVDSSNSLDNIQRLSTDRIGYRSTHFVCDIGKARTAMKEYSSFSELKFEIQIRTILQHAWASLTHDRNYKVGKSLPENIQRKINLYSGMLEIVDMGFSEVINDIESYKTLLLSKDMEEFIDDKIDSINLIEYINKMALKHDYHLSPIILPFDNEALINELQHFNIFNLSQLQEIVPDKFWDNIKKHGIETTYIGVVRNFLIIKNYHKLAEIPDKNWTISMDDEEYEKAKRFYTEYMDESNFYEMMEILE